MKATSIKDKSLKLTKVQALFFPLVMGLVGLSTILTVYAGSVEVIPEGRLSFGNIAEFIIHVNMLTWPVCIAPGWTSSQVQRAEASAKTHQRVFLKTKTDVFSGKKSGTRGRWED